MVVPNDDTESLMEFPCDFPLKVMGKDNEEFHTSAYAVVQRHVGKLTPDDVRSRKSSGGTFIALTFRFQARSREQLDALYTDLNANEYILMVL